MRKQHSFKQALNISPTLLNNTPSNLCGFNLINLNQETASKSIETGSKFLNLKTVFQKNNQTLRKPHPKNHLQPTQPTPPLETKPQGGQGPCHDGDALGTEVVDAFGGFDGHQQGELLDVVACEKTETAGGALVLGGEKVLEGREEERKSFSLGMQKCKKQ